MGVVGSSRVSGQPPAESFTLYGPEEQNVYLFALNALQQDGGTSQEQKEILARKEVERWRSYSDAPF